MSRSWGHDELAADLAGHLFAPDRMVWTDLQLGPQGSPRPDVYTIDKSFVRPNPTAFECKISTSDFRADVTSGKWLSYLEYAYSVTFAVPAGLVTKDQVPAMCGLIVRHENAWRMAKKATINPRPIAQDALIKLLIDGVHREGPKARAKRWNDTDVTRKFAQKFGHVAARWVADAASAERTVEHANWQARQITERAEAEAKGIRDQIFSTAPERWRELLEVLGLKADASKYSVERAINTLRAEREETHEARMLREIVNTMRRAIERGDAVLAQRVSA
jgi:hypothetical protein